MHGPPSYRGALTAVRNRVTSDSQELGDEVKLEERYQLLRAQVFSPAAQPAVGPARPYLICVRRPEGMHIHISLF